MYFKDHLKIFFFAFEEGMNNKTSFENGKVRRSLDMVTGGTYMKHYSIKSIKKLWPHYQLRCGEKTFFKTS